MKSKLTKITCRVACCFRDKAFYCTKEEIELDFERFYEDERCSEYIDHLSKNCFKHMKKIRQINEAHAQRNKRIEFL